MTDQQPLWKVMWNAGLEAPFNPHSPAADVAMQQAFKIEALVNQVLPEEPAQSDYLNSEIGWIINSEEAIRCDERQKLRQQLLDAAAEARGVDND